MPKTATETPTGWTAATLGDVTKERGNRVGRHDEPTVLSSTKHHGLVPSDEYFKGRTIYSSNISLYKLVFRYWFAYATNHLAEGSIGLQRDLDVGCVSPIYTVFSCSDAADPRFMFRLLKSPVVMAKFKVHEQASVDRRGAVRYRDFSKIQISLPPIVEQRRIADILDSADDSIRHTERLVNKLAAIRNAEIDAQLMPWLSDARDAVGIRADNDGEPLTRRRLGAVTSVNVGYVGPLSAHIIDSSSGVPLLSTKSIGEGRWAAWDGRRVSRAFAKANRKSQVLGGDLIVARHGESGSAAVIPDQLSGAQCLNVVVVRRCSQFIPEFLALLLSWRGVAKEVSAAKAGSVQGVVNTAEMERLNIPVPTVLTQRRILSVVETYDHRISVENANLCKMKLVKQGLIEDLLTGRVRVNLGEGAAG